MLSPTMIRLVIAVTLTGHGLAHAIALGNLVIRAIGGEAGGLAVRTWLLPGLEPGAAAVALAVPFWLIATLGFLATALTAWGLIGPGWPWRGAAVLAAVVSTVGIVLFGFVWPGGDPGLRVLHIGAALAMNAAILGTQLVLHRPRPTVFSR